MSDGRELLTKDDLKGEFEEWKKFAFKEDMMKIAIAFILGAAFNKVVGSISENILMPFLNFIISKTGENWREAAWEPVEGMSFEIGQFGAAILDFVLITIVLFILWRVLRGKSENPKPILERIKEFVLADWFFAFAAGIALAVVFFSTLMAGVWVFIGLSLAVLWFQKRELKNQAKTQQEKIDSAEKKIDELKGQ